MRGYLIYQAISLLIYNTLLARPATSLLVAKSGKSHTRVVGRVFRDAASARLPTRYAARIPEVCGFDDVSLPSEGPWSRYARRHAALREQGRSLVYVAREGLGSRLRGVATAFLLAMRSGRSLEIMWDGLELFMLPNFIDWRASDGAGSNAEDEDSITFGDDVSSTALLDDSQNLPRVVVLPHEALDLPDRPLAEIFDAELSQLAESYRDDTQGLLGCTVRFLFRPSSRLVAALAEADRGPPVIGVQMRFGDLVAFGEDDSTVYTDGGDTGSDERLQPNRAIVEAMVRCPSRRMLLGAGAAVRFASDWQPARRWAKAVASGNVSVLDSEPLHLEHIDWAAAGADTAAAGAWTEFLLLAGADAILASGSRQETRELFRGSLLNTTGGAAGLCRASMFATDAAAVGFLPKAQVFYGLEDCGVSCGRPLASGGVDSGDDGGDDGEAVAEEETEAEPFDDVDE